MNEIDVVKVRCFDAEQRVVELTKQTNDLTQNLVDLASKVGVLQYADGKPPAFSLDDLSARVDRLLAIEDAANTKTKELPSECIVEEMPLPENK